MEGHGTRSTMWEGSIRDWTEDYLLKTGKRTKFISFVCLIGVNTKKVSCSVNILNRTMITSINIKYIRVAIAQLCGVK